MVFVIGQNSLIQVFLITYLVRPLSKESVGQSPNASTYLSAWAQNSHTPWGLIPYFGANILKIFFSKKSKAKWSWAQWGLVNVPTSSRGTQELHSGLAGKSCREGQSSEDCISGRGADWEVQELDRFYGVVSHFFVCFFVQEEALEREKQQQVVLLQELEEQKARLEQMLIEAQQERECLKAAVTQEVPIDQTEVPVHDQEVTSASPGLATEVGPC